MKLQLIILGLLVVATFAHRHADEEGENQIGRRRHYRGRHRNDNQIAANADDADLEDSISSEDEHVPTERSQRRGCGARRGGERRGNHRHQFQHDTEFHQRSGVDGNEGGEHHHQSGHNAEWHEKHGVPMPSEDSTGGKHHHRHHHHHRHRTTTISPVTTTTSTSPPSVDDFGTGIETDFHNQVDNDSTEALNFDP